MYKVKPIAYDINTQFGCIDGFKMTTKNLTMKDIKLIFEKILKEHEVSIFQNNQEMFHKREETILALISGKKLISEPMSR